jgi:hypothetical protein
VDRTGTTIYGGQFIFTNLVADNTSRNPVYPITLDGYSHVWNGHITRTKGSTSDWTLGNYIATKL